MPFLRSKDSRSIIKEGSLDAVKIGVAETYISAFAIFLGASALQLGALATIPPLLGSFAQLLGMRLAESARSRKRGIIRLIQIQAFICLLFSFVTLGLELPINRIYVLMIFFSGYHITIGMIAPLWNSLIGDVVPANIRGRFLGVRNTWMAVVTLVAVVAGGEVIHFLDHTGNTAQGYCIIFVVASIARFLSSLAFRGVVDFISLGSRGAAFSFWQFIANARRSNFTKFVLFVGAMNFANAISGPYFAMYMLRDLRFTYGEYTLIVASVVLTQSLVVRSWGMFADQYGNRRILRLCGIMVCINPILWLLSSDFWSVVCIQIYSGCFWAGFNLSVANFVFDAVTPPKRARCFAYQGLINGGVMCLGSLLGGVFARQMSVDSGGVLAVFVAPSQFLWLFVVSALLRILSMSILFPLFKEVRSVPRIRSHVLLARVLSVRPLWGATYTFVSGLNATWSRKQEDTEDKE